MSKKFIAGVAAIVLVGLAGAAYLLQDNSYSPAPSSLDQAARELARLNPQLTNTSTVKAVAPVSLKMPHLVRLAIGGLGQCDDEKNRALGDLVTVKLTGAPGFDLIERQSLGAILKELNLSWSGLVRAKDALRVGKLLKAEWFLLGTEVKSDNADTLVVRVVDAQTGLIRDVAVFPAAKPREQIAADLAAFLRQARDNAATGKLHFYLAIGAFEDLSANNRQANFAGDLRAYLDTAYFYFVRIGFVRLRFV